MSIVVVAEDGSGLPDANSFINAAYADSYHANRLNTYWATLTADQKASCLIKASDYIDKRFLRFFRGTRMTRDQALSWPRISAFDDDRFILTGVPERLKKAAAEYALRGAIYNVLAPDPIRPVPKQDMTLADPNGDQSSLIVGPVRMKQEQVGPIKETTTYDSPAQYRKSASSGDSRAAQSNLVNDWYIPMYPEADLLIETLIDNTTSMTMERA